MGLTTEVLVADPATVSLFLATPRLRADPKKNVISANFPPIAGNWISVPGASNPRLPDRSKLPVTEKKDMEPRASLGAYGFTVSA
ncbi:MAG: hypothetical protein NTU59_08250 [Coprothermobacterota bacterium]|nr:hypothetical protein [Coprothermobacterota bacterium]